MRNYWMDSPNTGHCMLWRHGDLFLELGLLVLPLVYIGWDHLIHCFASGSLELTLWTSAVLRRIETNKQRQDSNGLQRFPDSSSQKHTDWGHVL